MALILIPLCSIMIQCSTNKPLKKIELKTESAIVAGEIHVFYNGEDVTDETAILFNEIMWGKYAYETDTSHLLLTELPLGNGHIARLKYKNFIINLPENKSSFTLTDNSKINYVGNIIIDWKGANSKPPNVFGLLGSLADEANPDGVIEIYVESQIDKIKNNINKKFGPNYEVISNEIKAAPFDSTAKINLSKSYDPKHAYSKVILTDSSEIDGKVVSKKEDKLYITKGRIVYEVKISKISKILKDGVDVTESTIESTEDNYIDFFNYVVKKVD